MLVIFINRCISSTLCFCSCCSVLLPHFMLVFQPRKNCILADEMGLGKTIQSITFLYEIFNMGIRGPFLIIAPLSTITNWEREFRTWTHMNVIVYHGSQISRQMILQYEMFHRDPQVAFECIMSQLLSFYTKNWRCFIFNRIRTLMLKFNHSWLLKGRSGHCAVIHRGPACSGLLNCFGACEW